MSAIPDLSEIATVAWAIELPLSPRDPNVLRGEAALLLDGLLTRCSRGQGALEVAIGEGLLALGVGERLMRLGGYAGIGDYAREELGIPASTAVKMARLARELRDRPLLRDAVWTGEAATGVEAEEEEPWEKVSLPLSPEARPVVDRALDLAGKALGATAPKWQRVEALCQEYLGAQGMPADATGAGVLRGPVEGGLEALMEVLERMGMSERAVEQRIALERRLQVLPRLRQAMRQRRVSYEKARLIAWQADDTTLEELIAVAESMTCIALRRKLEGDEERQMCARAITGEAGPGARPGPLSGAGL